MSLESKSLDANRHRKISGCSCILSRAYQYHLLLLAPEDRAVWSALCEKVHWYGDCAAAEFPVSGAAAVEVPLSGADDEGGTTLIGVSDRYGEGGELDEPL